MAFGLGSILGIASRAGGLLGGLGSFLGVKGIASIGIAGLAYFGVTTYIKSNANTIARLNKEVSTLTHNLEVTKVDNETLKHNIVVVKKRMDKLGEDYQAVNNTLNKLIQKNQQIEKNYNRLHEKLYRESKGKKSIEELAVRKPGLVEKVINTEIKRINKCVEALTGGVKNEKVDCTDLGL